MLVPAAKSMLQIKCDSDLSKSAVAGMLPPDFKGTIGTLCPVTCDTCPKAVAVCANIPNDGWPPTMKAVLGASYKITTCEALVPAAAAMLQIKCDTDLSTTAVASMIGDFKGTIGTLCPINCNTCPGTKPDLQFSVTLKADVNFQAALSPAQQITAKTEFCSAVDASVTDKDALMCTIAAKTQRRKLLAVATYTLTSSYNAAAAMCGDDVDRVLYFMSQTCPVLKANGIACTDDVHATIPAINAGTLMKNVCPLTCGTCTGVNTAAVTSTIVSTFVSKPSVTSLNGGLPLTTADVSANAVQIDSKKDGPTCLDGTQNGFEEHTDCGGPDCPVCGGSCGCSFPGGTCNETTGVCKCALGYDGTKCDAFQITPQICVDTCVRGTCAPCINCRTYPIGTIPTCRPCEALGAGGLIDAAMACHGYTRPGDKIGYLTCDPCYFKEVPSRIYDGVKMRPEEIAVFKSWPKPNCFENSLAAGKDLCESLVVSCENGYTTEIECSDVDSKGTLPDLTQFPKLTLIALNNAMMDGVLPEFSKIPNLVHLEMNDIGNLHGTIPKSMEDLKLKQILLAGHNLTGPLPNLTKLTTISGVMFFSGNQVDNGLTGPFPALPASSGLLALRAENNDFTGPFPKMNDMLQELRAIQITGNRLSGPFPDLSRLGKLENVQLADNQMTGPITADLLPVAMMFFEFMQNQFSGKAINITKLKNLKRFACAYNQFTGPLPDITGLELLEKLDVSYNKLSGKIPVWDSPRLKSITINGNFLTGGFPDLLKCPILVEFRAADNDLSGIFPPKEGLPADIAAVDISRNSFDEWGDVAMFSHMDIHILNLSHNKFPWPQKNMGSMGAMQHGTPSDPAHGRLLSASSAPGLIEIVADIVDISHLPWDGKYVGETTFGNVGELLLVTGIGFMCPYPESIAETNNHVVIVIDSCILDQATTYGFIVPSTLGVIVGFGWVIYKHFAPADHGTESDRKVLGKKVIKHLIQIADIAADTLFFVVAVHFVTHNKFDCEPFNQVSWLGSVVFPNEYQTQFDLSKKPMHVDWREELTHANHRVWPFLFPFYDSWFKVLCEGFTSGACVVIEHECIRVERNSTFLMLLYLAFGVAVFKEVVKGIIVTLVIIRNDHSFPLNGELSLNSLISPFIYCRNKKMFMEILRKEPTMWGVINEFVWEGCVEALPALALAVYFSWWVCGIGLNPDVIIAMVMTYISLLVMTTQLCQVTCCQSRKFVQAGQVAPKQLEGETAATPKPQKKKNKFMEAMSTVFSP